MRTCLFAAIVLAASHSGRCQDKPGEIIREGKITYERKTDMHRMLEDESMKAMVPQFTTSKLEVTFTSDASVCKNVQEEEDIRNTAGEDGKFVFHKMIGGRDDQTYINYTAEKITQRTELGPKKYIIEDSLHKPSWKLTGESRSIKGYTCKKAIATSKNRGELEAWYAENIQSPAGPELFGGLPGAILELSIDTGKTVFTALEIHPVETQTLVKAPTDGKRITRKAYEQMLKEQFGDLPEGGKPMIRIIRD